MECFVIIVNGFQPLTIITKHSILNGAAALDPSLEIYDIPPALIVNIDQTPLKTLPARGHPFCDYRRMCKQMVKNRNICQLIEQRMSSYTTSLWWQNNSKSSEVLFSKWLLSQRQSKSFFNTNEYLKFLKEVIKPYVKKQRQLLKLSTDQKTIVIMDVFTGHMTSLEVHFI